MKIVDKYTGYVAILAYCCEDREWDYWNCDFAVLKLDDFLLSSLKNVESVSESIRSSETILDKNKIESISLSTYNCSIWFLHKNIYFKDNSIKKGSMVNGVAYNIEFDEDEVEHEDEFGEFASEKEYMCLNEVPDMFVTKYYPNGNFVSFNTQNVVEYETFGLNLDELIKLAENKNGK
jgi:hypothetical protein